MRKRAFILLLCMSLLSACSSPAVVTSETLSSDDGTSTTAISPPTVLEDLPEEKVESTGSKELSVITIGTGTPEYSETKANASTAIKYGDQYYIVDCGDGAYGNLEGIGFDFSTVQGIFFTHHHTDHTTDFFDLYTKCLLAGDGSISIVGPPRTGLFVDFFNDVYLDDTLYRKLNTAKKPDSLDKTRFLEAAEVTEIIGAERFEVDGMIVTTAEMSHTMYTLAYRFDADGQSIVVSGDTSYEEDLITLSKDADILVIDGCLYKENTGEKERKETAIEPFYEYGGDFEVEAHLSFEDMVTIASEANVATLIITHYRDAEENRIEKSIRKIKETFSGNVIYATDMMELAANSTEKESTHIPQVTVTDRITYPIVDTNQKDFYSASALIAQPEEGSAYYGQDASYAGNQPSYTDHSDGTVTDNVTGLMWAKDMGSKMTYEEAALFADGSDLAGYDDWRIPTVKELYSLIQFDGRVFGERATDSLFINTDYFNQPLGDTAVGEREIDAQTWSSTFYVGETMKGDETLFGVNFIDGRIKGYPVYNKRLKADNEMYFRLVRGNPSYGENVFVDNGDGTVSDLATGLTWQQDDSGRGMDWQDALTYAESLELAGYDDWRLPNAKELQSIVDYSRSLQTTASPAIDPVFTTTAVYDVEGQVNYPYYWSGTSHMDGQNPYDSAVYIAFGEAQGEMNGVLMDVHGAGAQRSDPKTGSEDEYPASVGPQGDIRYVFNYVRCVRND